MGSVWDAVVQGYYLGKDARGRIDKYKKDKALEESLASAKSAYEKSLNSVQERSEDSPEMANLKGHLQDAVSQSTGGQVEEVGPGVYAPVQAQTDLKPMQAPEGGVVPSRGAPNPQAQAPMVSALGTPPMMRLTGAQAPAGQAPAGGKGFSDYNIQLDRDEPGLYQFKGIYDTPEVRAKNEQEAYQRSLSRRARLSGDKGIPNPSGDPSQTMDVKDLVRYGDKADIAKNQMMAERAYRNAKFDAYRQYYMDNPEALRKLDVEMRQARWGDAYQDLMDGVADGDMDSIRTLVGVHNAAVGENGNRIEISDNGKFNLVAPDGAILRQNYVPTNSELNRAGALWMAQKIASETGDFAGLTAAEDKAKDWAKGNLDATMKVAQEARQGMDAENVARHRQNTDALGLYGNQIKEEYYRSAGTGGGSGSTASNLAAMGLKSEKNDEGGYTIKNGNVPVGSMSMESSLFIPIGQTLDKVQELAREATASNEGSVVTFGRTPDGRPANLVVTPDGMAYELGKSPENKFEFSATGPSGAGGSGGRRQMGRTPPPQLLQQNTDFGSPYSRGRQTHGKAEWGGSPQQTTSQTSSQQAPVNKGIPTEQEAKAQVRTGGSGSRPTTKASGGAAPTKTAPKTTAKASAKDTPKEAPVADKGSKPAREPWKNDSYEKDVDELATKYAKQPKEVLEQWYASNLKDLNNLTEAEKKGHIPTNYRKRVLNRAVDALAKALGKTRDDMEAPKQETPPKKDAPKKETAIRPNPKSKPKPDPKQIEAERKAISEDVKKHMQYAQDDDAPSQHGNASPEEYEFTPSKTDYGNEVDSYTRRHSKLSEEAQRELYASQEKSLKNIAEAEAKGQKVSDSYKRKLNASQEALSKLLESGDQDAVKVEAPKTTAITPRGKQYRQPRDRGGRRTGSARVPQPVLKASNTTARRETWKNATYDKDVELLAKKYSTYPKDKLEKMYSSHALDLENIAKAEQRGFITTNYRKRVLHRSMDAIARALGRDS